MKKASQFIGRATEMSRLRGLLDKKSPSLFCEQLRSELILNSR